MSFSITSLVLSLSISACPFNERHLVNRKSLAHKEPIRSHSLSVCRDQREGKEVLSHCDMWCYRIVHMSTTLLSSTLLRNTCLATEQW